MKPVHPKKTPALRAALLIGVLALLSHGCAERPRSNPLDPDNPATLGKPAAVLLSSAKDTIRISWRRLQLDDLTAYNLYRRLSGERTYTKIGSYPPEETSAVETGAVYDIERYYRLTAVAGDFESPASDSARIRPGPTEIWALDNENAQVVKYTHDASHEIFRVQVLLRPFFMEVDASRQSALISGLFSSQLVRLERDGTVGSFLNLGTGIQSMALDTVDQSAWLANPDSSWIRRVAVDGAELGRFGPVGRPVALAFDPGSRSVWVLDKTNRSLLQVDSSATLLHERSGFRAGHDIALNAVTQQIWVADSNRVVRYDRNAADPVLAIDGFDYAARVAVDPQSGACWVADWGPVFGQARIVKLNAGGVQLFALDGYVDPRRLAISPFNGTCFVADVLVPGLSQISSEGVRLPATPTIGGLADVAVVLLPE